MKICVLEAEKHPIYGDGITAAHVRQAKTIVNHLKQRHVCDLYNGESIRQCISRDYDVIIKSYALFYENHDDERRVVENNPQARLFWLTNEYDIDIGGTWRKFAKEGRPIDVIANFVKEHKFSRKHYFVNMNSLFYQDKKIPTKKYNVCYFGTYRKNRAKYFKKYFNDKGFMLSTTLKNAKKFSSIGCKFTPLDKFVWSARNYDTLGYFRYSLYIEDIVTHTMFNNLADRFYEALSNHTVTLFDKSCINTLRKSEIDGWEDFLIDSSAEMYGRNYEEDWEKQSQWIPIVRKEKQKSLETIENILTGKI